MMVRHTQRLMLAAIRSDRLGVLRGDSQAVGSEHGQEPKQWSESIARSHLFSPRRHCQIALDRISIIASILVDFLVIDLAHAKRIQTSWERVSPCLRLQHWAGTWRESLQSLLIRMTAVFISPFR